MGLLGTVCFGPIKGVVWVAEQVQEAAERQYYDESAILRSLARLNEEYDLGAVDDEAFARREDELMERLEHARARSGVGR